MHVRFFDFDFSLFSNQDLIALILFAVCWLGYEPLLKLISSKIGSARKDLSIVRMAWMKEFVSREVKIFDSNLLGHSVNTASFMASANLLIIAAVAGVIFEGNLKTGLIKELGIDAIRPLEVQMKLSLVLLCLVRGLLDFIWALRQMNYCAAALGAVPEKLSSEKNKEFSRAVGMIIDPAMSSFSQGVRTYYFSIAAALWLFGAWPMAIGTLIVFLILALRQTNSKAAKGLRELRILLENESQDQKN